MFQDAAAEEDMEMAIVPDKDNEKFWAILKDFVKNEEEVALDLVRQSKVDDICVGIGRYKLENNEWLYVSASHNLSVPDDSDSILAYQMDLNGFSFFVCEDCHVSLHKFEEAFECPDSNGLDKIYDKVKHLIEF